MKIGIVCFPGMGGSGVVAAELGKALAARGHEIHFVTTDLPFRVEVLGERIWFHPVTPMPYPVFPGTPYTLALATRLAEVAQNHCLDIVHAHYAIPHSTAAYLARVSCRCDLKVITTLHGTDTRLVGLDPSYRHIVRFSIEESHGVTAVSRYLAESSIRDFELTRPVDVIYNFVDTERFRPGQAPQLREMLSERDELVCIHVSNMRPVKGVLDVIRAHATVAAETGARLVLVGDGPQREEAAHLASELGVLNHVTFLGSRENVAPYLAAADLYIQGSREESFGLAALEAMSSGLPVVAFRVGGLPELVLDGQTGCLAPLDDVEALAAGAVSLLRDESLRRQYGEAARRRAVECFDTAGIVEHYENLYADVMAAEEAL